MAQDGCLCGGEVKMTFSDKFPSARGIPLLMSLRAGGLILSVFHVRKVLQVTVVPPLHDRWPRTGGWLKWSFADSDFFNYHLEILEKLTISIVRMANVAVWGVPARLRRLLGVKFLIRQSLRVLSLNDIYKCFHSLFYNVLDVGWLVFFCVLPSKKH